MEANEDGSTTAPKFLTSWMVSTIVAKSLEALGYLNADVSAAVDVQHNLRSS